MKKDIDIPEVNGVYLAAVKQFNKDFRAEEWNAYLINDRDDALDMVLIVSRGFSEKDQTSVMRHKIEKLPPKSFAKVEFLQEEVLALNNEFQVTFFAENKMFEKKFLFRKNTINDKALRELPLIPEKGILLK
ncbi:MAG: hypothetical protein RI572_00595 [Salegentibacter sp.]|uniref:Phenylalanyl-tRNA synthetase subunit alpha n=1 Tax=Salegentibacter flavus TaxID=287099 RepID=A0A1I5AWR6_9FLAO|nr:MULTISPECIES: hypothetical protein [Salegentibacter]MDR9455880.1 hypothetical protein [Salegentibacter sp.]SFN66893.1 hypothetical protein SAMN05660413_02067 [Salegentibacter flavus]